MIKTITTIIAIVTMLITSCGNNNGDVLPPTEQENTSQELTTPAIAVGSYQDENITFALPNGTYGESTTGEYFDLGVEEVFTVTDPAKAHQFFTISKAPLTDGESLQDRYNAAYKKGPEPEELEILSTVRGALSGIELLYQRPWGEPRWRFHDLWVEINGSAYVFSYRVYATSYDPDSMFFDDMLAGVNVIEGSTDALEAPTMSPSFPLPPATARIAFAAVGWTVPRSGEEIFVMNVDGSGITAISNSEGDDRDPAWSPDGRQIAFISERDGNNEVYIMNADGTDQHRVTNSPENEHFPAWSPDGAEIVFSRLTPDNANDLFVIEVATGAETRLTNSPKIDESYPDWSPNGKKILYSSFGGAQSGIFVMKTDGSEPRLLISGPLHFAAWSPDGARIALDGEPGGNKFEVYIINADGTGLLRVTQHPGGSGEYNKAPSWSPDGKRLVYFSTNRSGAPGVDVFIINIDGSGETQLTFGKNDLHNGGMYPDWSPVP